METAPAWLARLPADRAFVLAAAAVLVGAALVRAVVARTRAGAAFLSALHAAEASFVALLLAAMIGLSFVQIVLRNLAHTGLVWIDPLLRHLLLWIGFAAAPLATRLGRHISIDALSRLLPRAARRITGAASGILAAYICLLVAAACLDVVRAEARAGTRAFLSIPTWLLQLVMPAGMLLAGYRFLRQAVAAALGGGARGERPA